MAQSAFFMTAGTVSMAERRCSFSALSRTYVSMRSEYISEWMFSMATEGGSRAARWSQRERRAGVFGFTAQTLPGRPVRRQTRRRLLWNAGGHSGDGFTNDGGEARTRRTWPRPAPSPRQG